MILRCLPPAVLAEDISKFEANGKAATEIGLPMNMILGQLPSGKVEMALQDLVPHFPAGFLQPTESITSYLSTMISLPLMDVVMRIPPDLLALRPDQKDVDASVINMADPFTEEILREQAEAARRQTQPNIIEESQAPQEEFVPRDQANLTKSIVPPRRPQAEPLVPSRMNALTERGTPPPPLVKAQSSPPPASTPLPPLSSLRGSMALPSIPTPTIRSASSSGQISALRATSALPTRPQAPVTMQIDTQASAPVPPVPRHTAPVPAPPPPRHTTSLPVPRRTGPVPAINEVMAPTVPLPGAQVPTSSQQAATPAPSSDNLARLAALAMAQLGEGSDAAAEAVSYTEPTVTAPTPSSPVPTVAAPAPAPKIEASVPAPFPAVAPSASQRMASAPISIPPPMPRPTPVASAPKPVARSLPPVQATESEAPAASVAFNLNTCTAEDLVKNIPDCSNDLAESIVQHRVKIGSFKRLEDLLDVPGITKAAYKDLTGEEPPSNRIPLTLNELLGYSKDLTISLKDVTDRIACWPDVTGCVLSQSTGLSLVGTVPEGVDKAAVVAFAPRMFEAINKSFSEVSTGQDTDALVIPTHPTSFHLFRNKDLYLIIMSRLPQMPERHVKVARFVLSALSIRKD